MGEQAKRGMGAAALAEMQEFATFEKGTQRYIRRSLDIGFRHRDALRLWARDPEEAAAIRGQVCIYARLEAIRKAIPDDNGFERAEPMMAALISVTAFDLVSGRLPSFAAYRFLYERLLGAAARPWLPSAFCAASTLPHLHPDDRRTLLQTIGEGAATAPGWSIREPTFFPQWVDKVDLIAA
ncbi:MAG: hypothetical protein JWO25_2573 [Alphaproteobacteria bacterium]|nr:hypothetical protein [Alphaproteobacteria bacterium]MDB5721328.1 hypothetical protein [Alphaproteobacteria bacterium]